MSNNAEATWTEAVSYARELIDPWARNDQWNECDALSHELEEATGQPWGDAFIYAAAQLGTDISELVAVANWLADRPQHIGVTAAELRELMGERSPASL